MGILLCCALAATPVEIYLNAFWHEARTIARNPVSGEVHLTERAIEGVKKPGNVYHVRGDVLVPGATLEAVVQTVRNYNSHGEFFAPTIRSGRICATEGEDTLRFRYWTTPYMDSITETRAVHRRIGDKQYEVDSVMTGIGGLGDLPDRKDLCRGTLPGVFYMKQLHSIWRFEQIESGVRIETELVAELSGWPLVRSTAKRVLSQMLSRTLEQYRTKLAS